MNWIGGTRNRFRGLNDDQKKQKEFFERRRLANRVKSATSLTTPAGKKKSISRDILHLQCVKQTKRSPFKDEDAPSTCSSAETRNSSRHERSPIHRVVKHIDLSHGRNRFGNIGKKSSSNRSFKHKLHLPNVSPCKQPSNIELADATDDEHSNTRQRQFKHLPSYQSTPIDQFASQRLNRNNMGGRHPRGVSNFQGSALSVSTPVLYDDIYRSREKVLESANKRFYGNIPDCEESFICERSRSEKKVNFSHINEYYSLSSDSETRSDPHSCFDVNFLLGAGTSTGIQYPSPASFDMMESATFPQILDEVKNKHLSYPTPVYNNHEELFNRAISFKNTFGETDRILHGSPKILLENLNVDALLTSQQKSCSDLIFERLANNDICGGKREKDKFTNPVFVGIDDTPILGKGPRFQERPFTWISDEEEVKFHNFSSEKCADESLQKWLKFRPRQLNSSSGVANNNISLSFTPKTKIEQFGIVAENNIASENIPNSCSPECQNRTLTESPKLKNQRSHNSMTDAVQEYNPNESFVSKEGIVNLCDLYANNESFSPIAKYSSNQDESIKHGSSGNVITQNADTIPDYLKEPCSSAKYNTGTNIKSEIFDNEKCTEVYNMETSCFPWIINKDDGLASEFDMKDNTSNENSMSLVKILTGTKTPVELEEQESQQIQSEVCKNQKETPIGIFNLANIVQIDDFKSSEVSEKNLNNEVTMILSHAAEKLNESLGRTNDGSIMAYNEDTTTTEVAIQNVTTGEEDKYIDANPEISSNCRVQTATKYLDKASSPIICYTKSISSTKATQTGETHKGLDSSVEFSNAWVQTERYSPPRSDVCKFHPRVELGVDVRDCVTLNHGSAVIKRRNESSASQSSDDSVLYGKSSSYKKRRSNRKRKI
uniref:uncharacterized protein LOC120330151 n=1 Tax=Styela clava TaxID=7725 RepID=UPI001939BBDB|nr:uncharacterized protein LOC120330151 [Styela clava]